MLSMEKFVGRDLPKDPFHQLLLVAEVAADIYKEEKLGVNIKTERSLDSSKASAAADHADDFIFPMQKGKRMKRKKRLHYNIIEPILSHASVSSSSPSACKDQKHRLLVNVLPSPTEKPKWISEKGESCSAAGEMPKWIFEKGESSRAAGEMPPLPQQPPPAPLVINPIVNPPPQVVAAPPQPTDDHQNGDELMMAMPQELQDYIRASSGSDVVFIIEKQLSGTDVSPSHSRLSLPLLQLKADFLKAEEKETLSARNANGRPGAIQVSLIPPTLQRIAMSFKRWDMRKKAGKVSSSYVLVKPWNEVVEENGLREGDWVRLWSFRCASQICLALVEVQQPQP
ncbi:B3 domain-containing protein At3g25182-like [Malania oleifera]|uniref:B3 domain-containing protein At3g25182-like n=1 Tax=Malania oleifera TaxID=397392 RepID=UPI0025AE99F4|nr:B3 domain-containing protein At3g25182-like [Malania oleifera]